MRAGPLNRSGGPSPLSTTILVDRYLAPDETTCNGVFKRVAHALTAAEQPDQHTHLTRLFYASLLRGAIGAEHIMTSVGSVDHRTTVNCFMHPIGTSEQSVADASDVERVLHAARRILQIGGGVGYGFLVIAPADAEQATSYNGAGSVCVVLNSFDRVYTIQTLVNT